MSEVVIWEVYFQEGGPFPSPPPSLDRTDCIFRLQALRKESVEKMGECKFNLNDHCIIHGVFYRVCAEVSNTLQQENTRLAVRVEELEHEVGTLKEKLRRIVGYVNSAWREGQE